MVRTQIRLPDDLYRRAKQFEEEHEMSLAELTRRGLELLLNRYPRLERRRKLSWLAIYVYHWQIDFMLAIRLDTDIEKRLDRLAKKTGRTKTFYAREAILEHLEDLEDIYLTTQRLQRPAKTYSAQDVKRELGL